MTLSISDKSAFYSPFSFLSKSTEGSARDFIDDLGAELAAGKVNVFAGVAGVELYFRRLDWDSNFFGVATYRVDYSAIPAGTPFTAVQAAYGALRAQLVAQGGPFYLFAEVPAEDTAAIAGMSGAGWRMIETRITCFRDDVQRFAGATAAVRSASADDIPQLRQAAMGAVNHYDRFHADDFFTPQQADDFLAIFIENSVKGYADAVIVPADGPADAFLTGNYMSAPASLAGRKLAKPVLSAVSPARRGWYVKLIGALTQQFKDGGIDTAFMTTQATNRAVLKVWHHHGYRYGRCTHIFSTYSRSEDANI